MNKNVPKLRFKDFEGEWKDKKLVNFLSESRIPGSDGSKAKKLTVKLWAKGVVPKKEIYEGSDNTKYYTRKAGQLMYGKLDFLNCAFGIVPNELDGYESTVDAPAFDIKNINSYFLFSKIIQKNFYKKNGDIADGSRKAKRIHSDVFLDMSIKVPSLQEQEKIANFLTKVDSIMEKQDKKIEYWNFYKKGMMQKIFLQKIRFKDQNGCDYPEWGEKFIGDVCDVGTGKKDTQDKIDNGEYPFFVRSQTIESINSYSFDGEAILTAGDGVGVGKVFHYVDCKFDYHQRVYKLSDFKNINGRYLYEYFSKNFKREVAKYNAKTSVDSVRLEMITKMKIPYPCLKEQTKIANFLSNIDNIIEKENKKLEKLKQWKKGLLQQMFV